MSRRTEQQNNLMWSYLTDLANRHNPDMAMHPGKGGMGAVDPIRVTGRAILPSSYESTTQGLGGERCAL